MNQLFDSQTSKIKQPVRSARPDPVSVGLSRSSANTSADEDSSYTDLLPLIAPYSYPVFITDSRSDVVITANSTACAMSRSHNPVGRPLKQIIPHLEEIHEEMTMAYFNKRWLVFEKELLQQGETCYHKVSLREHPELPGEELIASVKDMIAVMLHRFRSPITGMQGYLDLLRDDSDSEQGQKRIGLLNKGLMQLNEMLNELEGFYSSSSESEVQPLYLQAVTREIQDSLAPEARGKITIRQHGKDRPVHANRDKLKKMLEILVTNALEHSAPENDNIYIDLESTRRIVITNYGKPMPDFVKNRMFLPFMTNKAQNMGIGLTQAHLLARFIGASLFLTQNCKEKGISFTILLPPPSLS